MHLVINRGSVSACTCNPDGYRTLEPFTRTAINRVIWTEVGIAQFQQLLILFSLAPSNTVQIGIPFYGVFCQTQRLIIAEGAQVDFHENRLRS